mgnify:CR=1 FL=1
MTHSTPSGGRSALTLQQWINRGGCNLSNDCLYAIRKFHGFSEKQMRQMPLLQIFALQPYGQYARRQIRTYRKTRSDLIRRSRDARLAVASRR